MFVVGLTGGIGSGKSTVAEYFQALGVCLVDADLIARDVVEPGSAALDSIAQHFGSSILLQTGNLDRSQLRHIVFSQPQEKDWLEGLLHPLIGQCMQSRIANCKSLYCLLVSPLLLETDQKKLVDRVLVVDVSESNQLARTLARDGGDESTIRAIIDSQISRQTRLQHADDVLDNEQSLGRLNSAVATLHNKYLELANESG
ncbi:MAG: dephospho-CoA kinase [Gammaproteobacteria bacterium]|jgi:dephospho-CoA kinase|nr:dephospho-CoA kinase [Gammaproteobacteria bacterium]MDP6732223.1 dephospho-CoA kinase [Gammaproteobacteria bacterium]|tara:strand:- start:2811 stop:3413 length:603 start_codon:yes stop_codon:yes gene_type:complete